MQKLIRISVLAGFLVALAYQVIAAAVGGRGAAAQALTKIPLPTLSVSADTQAAGQ
jgi:hypothetical protein